MRCIKTKAAVWTVVCLALGVLGGLGPTMESAHAESRLEDAVVKVFGLYLEQGDAASALKFLQGDERETLLEDASTLASLTAHAARHAQHVILTARRDDTRALVKAVEVLCDEVLAADGEDAHAHVARANAHLLRGIYENHAEDGEPCTSHHERAAACRLDAAKVDTGNESIHVLEAAACLLRAVPTDDTSRPRWVAKARGLLVDGLKANPDSVPLRIGMAGLAAEEIETCMANRKKSQAKKAAKSALDLLEPLASERGAHQAQAIRQFNGLLRRTQTHKLKDKRDYIGREITFGNKTFTFVVPRHMGWELDRGTDQVLAWLERTDADGTRHMISVCQYQWNMNYLFDTREVGGDSASGMASVDRQDEIREYEDVARERKKLKGRLTRKIRKTIGYELRGTDPDGYARYTRAWVFKGEHMRKTYAVRCRVIGPGAEHGIDPATMAIVESLVELERAR